MALAKADPGPELLAGLRAAPDDAEARAVYADYLEERGDAALATYVRAHGPPVDAALANRLLDVALNERRDRGVSMRGRGLDLGRMLPTTVPILASPQHDVWVRVLLERMVRLLPVHRRAHDDLRALDEACRLVRAILSHRLRSKPTLEEADVIHVLGRMSEGDSEPGLRHELPYPALTAVVERFVARRGATPAVIAAIEHASRAFFRNPDVVIGVDDAKIRARLDALLP